jgi:hypothetical protein
MGTHDADQKVQSDEYENLDKTRLKRCNPFCNIDVLFASSQF